jgi:hypothetical protein
MSRSRGKRIVSLHMAGPGRKIAAIPQKVGSILTRDARVARSAQFNYCFLVSRAVAEPVRLPQVRAP